jgi:hypothetical protein
VERLLPASSPGTASTDKDDADPVWTAVDRLIDSTDDLAALYAHRLHLLAARRWRGLGREVPPELEQAERLATLVTLLVPEVVGRIREVVAGPLVVYKGPEIATRYPDPALRPYVDLDILVPDAAAAQRALVDAGFVEVGDADYFAASPHSLPLAWRDFPLLIEVHRHPNWRTWLAPPPTEQLLESAVPSSLGVEGVLTLAPSEHVLVVAVHTWAHGPLTRLRDLIDVAVLSRGLDPDELESLAGTWGIERLWRTTRAAAEAVLGEGAKPLPLRLWARNLLSVRERTVFESHLGQWLEGFSTLPAPAALAHMLREVGGDLRPVGTEGWGEKLRRTGRAVRNAFRQKSIHDEELLDRDHRD